VLKGGGGPNTLLSKNSYDHSKWKRGAGYKKREEKLGVAFRSDTLAFRKEERERNRSWCEEKKVIASAFI